MFLDEFRPMLLNAITQVFISKVILKIMIKETADLDKGCYYFVRTVIHLKYYQRYDFINREVGYYNKLCKEYCIF